MNYIKTSLFNENAISEPNRRIPAIVFFGVIFGVAGLSACNPTPALKNAAPVSCPAALTTLSSATIPQSYGVQSPSAIPAIARAYTDQGKLDATQVLPITLALTLNNLGNLDLLLSGLYDPNSPSFHQFLSSGEFKSRFAPSPSAVAAIEDYLLSHGIQPLGLNANGYLMRASGSVATLSAAFQTEIHQYQDSSGTAFFAPSIEPTLPQGLSISAVHGLHNITQFRSLAQPRSEVVSSIPQFGTGPNLGMSPKDIQKSYNLPSGLSGAGQTLALVELGTYAASDIVAYQKYFGLPILDISPVIVDAALGAPTSGGASSAEVTLDIELMAAIAPQSKILVYEAPNNGQAILDIYAKIANDNLASQISTSWGSPEDQSATSFLDSENTIFKQMAAQGQSMYAAAGDSGAYDNGTTLSVSDPASQPYVVGVGGTQLNSTSAVYGNEVVWDNGSGSAGGGGISVVWSLPSWQTNLRVSGTVSGTMRNVPDVSLNSDPNTGYAIYLNGAWRTYGGTSAAAPLWAAFTALVNQQRTGQGLALLGFPNPTFYPIGNGAQYGLDFHDITQGSNLYYPAAAGYDNATGWGSFNGGNLLQDLSAAPQSPVVKKGC